MTDWNRMARRVWAESLSRAVFIPCGQCQGETCVWFEPGNPARIYHQKPACWEDWDSQQRVWQLALREVWKRDLVALLGIKGERGEMTDRLLDCVWPNPLEDP